MLDQSITLVSDIESHKREVREGQKKTEKPVDKYTENEFVQQVQVEIEIQNFFKQLVILYTKTFLLDILGTNICFSAANRLLRK